MSAPALLLILLRSIGSGLAFINPGVGVGFPTGFQLPKLGQGLYLPSVSKTPARPQYGYNLKSDGHRHLVQKPIYYGDTAGPVDVYRDPVSSYHIKTANSPDSRFASDFVKISAPLVSFSGEPIIQAVQNPYQAITALTEEPEPQPEPAPSVSSYSGENVSSEGSFVSVGPQDLELDLDDPFEPEAEVDLEIDFLPSVNPLSQLTSSVPSPSHPLQTNFISQSLELLPQSFLQGVRLQRQFEDQVADLREDNNQEHELEFKQSNNHKRENIQEIYPESKEAILTDAFLNRDKILAYNVYKNQWTTSGDKKLVVDASKALQDYYRKYNLPADRQFSRDHNDFDIELSGPGLHQPERDNQIQVEPPSRFSFFAVTPSGPQMPFMGSIIQDMRTLFSSPIFPKSGSDMMFSVREVLHNMRNAHGDKRFDVYDWIPLFAVLFATALILNGIFPNSLALTGQGLSFGRNNRAEDGLEEEEEESVLDSAMAQLENGVLLMSAIREGGQCSARLACRLGQMTRENSERSDMILDAVQFLAPTISRRYNNFTSSFSAAVRAEDLSACSAQCSRCLVI